MLTGLEPGAGLCSRHLDVQRKRPLAIWERQGLPARERGCGYWLRRVPLDWMRSECLIRFELMCWIGPNPTCGADSGRKHVDRGRQRPSGVPTALHRGLTPTAPEVAARKPVSPAQRGPSTLPRVPALESPNHQHGCWLAAIRRRRVAFCEILVSQGHIAQHSPRPPAGVISSGQSNWPARHRLRGHPVTRFT